MKARHALSYASPITRTPQRMPDWCFYSVVLGPVILGIAAAMMAPRLAGRGEDSGRFRPTQADVSTLQSAVDQFQIDCGRYPTTAEGMSILARPPVGGHQYINRLPKDEWGRAYVYRCPSLQPGEPYDLLSLGKDGIEGTADDVR